MGSGTACGHVCGCPYLLYSRMEYDMMEEKKGISGFVLKMIAVVTMFIDHAAATVLAAVITQKPRWSPVDQGNYMHWYTIYTVLRSIGRMAFPIYCFLLVEGFFYTKNRTKYALRLFGFALLSEIPFDLAFNRTVLEFGYNNVFFTLLLGLLTIMAADAVREKIPMDAADGQSLFSRQMLRGLGLFAVMFAGCLLAELVFRSDYGATGVLAIFILYMMRERRLFGFALAVFVLGLLMDPIEFWAFLMLIPLHFYNGTRGRQAKYFFYAFYPAHILLLALACYALGLR